MPWSTAKQDPAYGKAQWKRARLACLRAASWKCQIRLDGCIGAATSVDHIDGLANDPDHRNLRAACEPCHAKVTAAQGHAARSGNAGDPDHITRTAW